MLDARTTARIVLLVAALAALSACAARYGPTLPPDLPPDPEPGTTYCKEWVEPVYRDVPRLAMVRPPCTTTVPETVCRLRFEDVCVKPSTCRPCRTPDKACEMAVVQTKPGGYVWKQDGAGCWKYCYEQPCYQWCDKRVTEEGIEYCVEDPPEYRTVAYREETTEARQVCVPGEYAVEWCREVYIPGHWVWKATKDCGPCDVTAPCPEMPRIERPCSGVAAGAPRSN